MNILFASGHPAQIHNFKFLKTELENRGHQVFWLATRKDISQYLFEIYGIKYETLYRPKNFLLSKVIVLVKNVLIILKYIKNNKIDFALSRVSPYISIASYILNIPHIGLTDTETSGIYDKVFSKFLSVLVTSKSFERTLRKDQLRFNGNIELFYLHPKRFQPIPKKKITELLNIKINSSYAILRFVSWEAYHDKGLSGFTDSNKISAVEQFSKYAKVFISAEKELPKELEKYRIKIPPEKMHDVLAHATLFFGESGTMASESSCLGTPSIYLNENWLGYLVEEQKYGLLNCFKTNLVDQKRAIEKGIELLKRPLLKEEMKEKQSVFLSRKIDPTAFFIWFIENYPNSFKIMKEDPDYQFNFM